MYAETVHIGCAWAHFWILSNSLCTFSLNMQDAPFKRLSCRVQVACMYRWIWSKQGTRRNESAEKDLSEDPVRIEAVNNYLLLSNTNQNQLWRVCLLKFSDLSSALPSTSPQRRNARSVWINTWVVLMKLGENYLISEFYEHYKFLL